MTDRAISKDAMLQALRDIHLPEDAAGGTLGEILAVLAIAGFGALLVAFLVSTFSRSNTTNEPLTVVDHLNLLSDLPPDERRVALLHLLKAENPAKYQALKQGLYRPNSQFDAHQIEMILTSDA